MPKKKVKQAEEAEAVVGRVEGLTYSAEEQKIRERTREEWLARYEDRLYGTNILSQVTGQIVRNRTRTSGIRETKFSCGAELAGAIDSYWHILFRDQERGANVMADIEHLASYLGLTRSTILRWVRGEDNLEFVEPLQIALDEIAMAIKQRTYTDKLNALLVMQNLQNNHNYIANQKSADVNVNVRLKHDLPPIEQLNEQMKYLP